MTTYTYSQQYINAHACICEDYVFHESDTSSATTSYSWLLLQIMYTHLIKLLIDHICDYIVHLPIHLHCTRCCYILQLCMECGIPYVCTYTQTAETSLLYIICTCNLPHNSTTTLLQPLQCNMKACKGTLKMSPCGYYKVRTYPQGQPGMVQTKRREEGNKKPESFGPEASDSKGRYSEGES